MKSRHQWLGQPQPSAAAPSPRRHRRLLGMVLSLIVIAVPFLWRLPPQGAGAHAHPPGIGVRAVANRAAREVSGALQPVKRWAQTQPRTHLTIYVAVMICGLAYLMLRE